MKQNQTEQVTPKSLAISFEHGKLRVLDQTGLPSREEWLQIQSAKDMRDAIYSLAVRGAPLIGVAAVMGLAVHVQNRENEFDAAFDLLLSSRPTAVNLHNCLGQARATWKASPESTRARDLMRFAMQLWQEDIDLCDQMAELGAREIPANSQVLTHCNTGGLATAGIGTALGVIVKAHAQGKITHVWVDETRPVLQGARLTAWELAKLKIPHTLICDNMAADLMRQNQVQSVWVGADRIAANGDVANKIGTYSLAVNAHFHKVPFYVVAPPDTFDPKCASGKDITIEQRSSDEVLSDPRLKGVGTPVWNPSFDVTPSALITKIITTKPN